MSELLTPADLAAYLHVEVDTLRKYRKDRENPLPSIGRGSGRRYSRAAVEHWLRMREDPVAAAKQPRIRKLVPVNTHF